MEVPFLDLKAQHAPLKEEILQAWSKILDSAGFVGGRVITEFEQEFAIACQTKYSIAVNSGTDALRFIFLALGLQPGDMVITVPNTFIATTEAITQAGGLVSFIDIDPKTYTLSPERLAERLAGMSAVERKKVKGIVPVHLYGQMADMDALLAVAKKYGLWVVEDACQAHLAEYKGHKAGSLGIAGAFSFYPGKNIGACGEAGAVTTNDEKLANRVKILRDHGQAQKYYHDIEGYNGRCDAVQVAALQIKLKHLPGWTEKRRQNAALYLEQLKDMKGIVLPYIAPGSSPVYHLFVILLDNRDAVMEKLKQKGISAGLHYPLPLHLQKAYSHLKIAPGAFPVTEHCAARLLSLPMFPELTKEQITYVCSSLKEVCGS